MTDILKKLDEAFRLLSTIPVSHDNVEVMATAKAKLRAVYAELEHKDQKKEELNE